MTFKDLFHNYFYGKPGKEDFTERDLPENRIQLFKEAFMVRKCGMMSLNLLYFAVWIPAIAWSLFNLGQIEGAGSEQFGSLLFSYLLVLFPLIAITGPFTAGISYVMRNWARGEHSFPFWDFKAAMKANWKQALLLSAINGALPLTLYVCLRFYSGMASLSAVFYLPIALILLGMLVWVLSAQLMPTMMVTYELSFGAIVKNAVIITLANFPRSLGIKLLTLILPILVTICAVLLPDNLSWAIALTLLAYALIVLSLNKLIAASFANFVFEKYLNPKIEGASVNIGLRSEKKNGKQ